MGEQKRIAGGLSVLTVSYGTIEADSRKKDIGGVEKAMQDAFPAAEHRIAYTGKMIRKMLLKAEGSAPDTPGEALEKLYAEGYREVLIQPTHLLSGKEYTELCETAELWRSKFERFYIGTPLLSGKEELTALAEIIRKKLSLYEDGRTAVFLMGHGSFGRADDVYAKLQAELDGAGAMRFYIGLVSTEPTVEELITRLEKETEGIRRIILFPLMLTAGNHVKKDLAGADEDSWKSRTEKAGYEVLIPEGGLGRWPEAAALYAEKARKIYKKETERTAE